MSLLKTPQYIAFYTLLRREIIRFFRIWPQTLLPSPITMILYFLIFGHFIGNRVGLVNGFSYSTFIAPGLIMMAIINNTYANVSGSFYGAKFGKNIEEMFVSILSPMSILIGFVLGGAIRGLLVGFIVTIIAFFFTTLHIHHVFCLIAVVILTVLVFGLAGLLNGIYARSFDDVNLIPSFVLTPLIYLGGVFYSLEMLPPFWQKVSYFNPIFSMVNVFRYSLLGVSDVAVADSLLSLTVVTAVLLVINYRCLSKGYGIRS